VSQPNWIQSAKIGVLTRTLNDLRIPFYLGIPPGCPGGKGEDWTIEVCPRGTTEKEFRERPESRLKVSVNQEGEVKASSVVFHEIIR
jgi:hypothetical protein